MNTIILCILDINVSTYASKISICVWLFSICIIYRWSIRISLFEQFWIIWAFRLVNGDQGLRKIWRCYKATPMELRIVQHCFKIASRMLHACLADARGKFKDALDLLKYSIRLLNGAWREPLGFFPLTCSESLVLKYEKNNQKFWWPTWNWVDLF